MIPLYLIFIYIFYGSVSVFIYLKIIIILLTNLKYTHTFYRLIVVLGFTVSFKINLKLISELSSFTLVFLFRI